MLKREKTKCKNKNNKKVTHMKNQALRKQGKEKEGQKIKPNKRNNNNSNIMPF